jgi:pSer/pThr/pTyr-binding forkhead associated (FHA) protein
MPPHHFYCHNHRAFATSFWTILNYHLELSLSGRRFPISVNGSRLGRAGSCEIAINDPILSRHHCLFEYVHGDLRLTDLASADGTFVNGEELCARTIVLRHNDVITVGSNTVKVK